MSYIETSDSLSKAAISNVILLLSECDWRSLCAAYLLCDESLALRINSSSLQQPLAYLWQCTLI
jgi:hypothetical protein